MILKKKQDQLQSSGPMRLFDHGNDKKKTKIDYLLFLLMWYFHRIETCGTISIEHLTEPRKIINRYQLSKSRFVFTLVEKKDGTDDFLFYNPMAVSDIMTEEDDVKSS